VGDSYDNALAESVIGLYKTKVIRQRRPWRSLGCVESAILEWVDLKWRIISVKKPRPWWPDSDE